MSERPVVVTGEARPPDTADRAFFSIAKTINLGNYQSLRVEYGEGRRLSPFKQKKTRDKEITNLVNRTLETFSELVVEVEKAVGD